MLILSQNKVSLKCCCCKISPPPPCKGIRISVCRIRNQENLSSACRIPLMIGIQKTSSTNKKDVQYMKSGILDVKSRIQQCLGFPQMGQRHRANPPYKKTNFAKRKSKKKNNWSDNRLTYCPKVPRIKPFLDLNTYYYKLLISCIHRNFWGVIVTPKME